MCVGCGARREQGVLVRLSLSGEGQPVLARGTKAPGRGAYLCGPACLAAAVKRKGLQRAFRGKLQVLETGALEASLRE